MKHLVSIVQQQSTWTIGNWDSISFWTDKWLDKPITDILQIPATLHHLLDMTIADYITDNVWSLPPYFRAKDRVN